MQAARHVARNIQRVTSKLLRYSPAPNRPPLASRELRKQRTRVNYFRIRVATGSLLLHEAQNILHRVHNAGRREPTAESRDFVCRLVERSQPY